MGKYDEFGEELSECLYREDMSASQLARRLGVNPSTVNRWGNGETRPSSPEMVARVADVLGIHNKAERAALFAAAGYSYIEQAPEESESTDTPALPESGDVASPTTSKIPVGDPQRRSTEISQEPALAHEPEQATEPPQKQWLTYKMAVLIVILVILTTGALAWQWSTGSETQIQRIGIRPWANSAADAYSHTVAENTRYILFQKLNQTQNVRAMLWHEWDVNRLVQQNVDYWLDIQATAAQGHIALATAISTSSGDHLATVAVQERIDQDEVEGQNCLLDLQNRLVAEIAEALDLPWRTAQLTAARRVPTESCEALRFNNLAAEQAFAGKLQSAEMLLTDHVLPHDPNYADAHNNLGQVYTRQGRFAEAIAQHQRAIALQEKNAIYQYNLGVAYNGAEENLLAVDAYVAALAADPLYLQAYNNLAITYAHLQEFELAHEQLQVALEFEPAREYLYRSLGRIYLLQGQPAEAIEALNHALERHDTGDYPEAFILLAHAYAAIDDIDQACAAFAQYLGATDEVSRRRIAREVDKTLTLDCE